MPKYTYGQLESIWLSAAGGTKYATKQWAQLMAAIALAESAGDPNAQNRTDNGGTQTSWGLWQISLGNHNPPNPNWNDPVENAKLAIGKLNTQGLTAWGTYDSGAYKQYLSGAAPSGLPPGGGAGGAAGGGDQSSGGTGTAATNPVVFKTGTVPGQEWAGTFNTGLQDSFLGSVGSTVQGLLGIATGVANLTVIVNKIAMLMLLLFRPSFWLRIGAAIVGFIALAGAAYFMKEAL